MEDTPARWGRSTDTQGANQPDHDGNSQYQAKNAAKAGPAIHAVAIVATASEQSFKLQFILEVSVYGFGRPRAKSLRIWKRGRQPVARCRSLALASCPHSCQVRAGNRAKHGVPGNEIPTLAVTLP
jgi:hypothetical protein